MKNLNIFLLLIIFSVIFAFQQKSHAQQVVSNSVISGGGTSSINGSYIITGTLGQPVTGTASGTVYTINAGFWHQISSVVLPPNQPPVADAGPDQTVFVDEEVTLDGSGSSDPDGTIENYRWDFGDGSIGNGSIVTHTFIAEDTYTVTLTVTDDDGAQATDDVTITVQTPSQATENLIADVENLSLNKGNINALTSKLYNAVSSLEKENNNSTINKLNAFINQVNAFIPKKISAEDGQALIEAANSIINQISGSLAKRGTIDKAAAQPREYAIEQNYPNPFNPETEIHYQLPKSSHVTLKLYNLMGQEIKTLVNNYHTAGYHSVKWDATNNHGMKVASGVYIYTIQAGRFVEVKKLVFLQ